jgi:hypothetical protein
MVALTISAACGGGPGVATQALPSLGGPAGSTGTVADLRKELLAFAHRAMGELARASEAALLVDSTATTRAFVHALQADVASASLALAVEPDAESAIKDLMVTISTRRSHLTEAAPKAVTPATLSSLGSSLEGLENDIWQVGSQFFAPAELQALEARVELWERADMDKAPSGVVRVADLPGSGGPGMGKGLFAPLDEATRQLESSVMLGERFLFLAERLPVISLWQAEAMTWEILASPESQRALSGFTVISSTLERMALAVDSFPMLLDDQREHFLSAFDEREATVRNLLDQASLTMGDAGVLAESGERVAALSTEAAAGLNETLTTAERLVKTLRDANAPGGAMSFDIEEYTGALDDFRASTEALNAALQKAEGLAGTPRSAIDHAAWRAAQLMLLFFALLAAYRFGPALLAGRRTTDA